jgi:uncharacterized protein
MTPIRFGPPSQQLFGVFHPSQLSTDTPARGVLLCPPWGQEAVRIHRMLRVLAERLARLGWHVMRFDYFGTGDSAGDDAQGNLAQWRSDIVLAHQELQRRSFSAEITWVGVRLGANLTAMAAGAAQPAPQHLLLWEPVLDGPAYLQALARSQSLALEASFGVVPQRYQQLGIDELLGFGIGAQLRSELMQLQPAALATPSGFKVSVIAQPEMCADAQRLGYPVTEFAHAFDWTSEEALNTALVPHAAVEQLLASITQTPVSAS